MARVRLRKPAEAIADLTEALRHEQLGWVRGRTYLELGKAADLAGNRAGAVAESASAPPAAAAAGAGAAVPPATRAAAAPYRGV
jgi:hypothetical protein